MFGYSIQMNNFTKTLIKKIVRLPLSLFQKDSSQDPFHLTYQQFVNKVNQVSNPRILEVGSRNFTGAPRTSPFSIDSKYVGFDIYEGENVDVVGDAHYLSKYFDDESFDALYSISVFEHLFMPWKAILEANKVLKTNGLIFISTHPTWPAHELPCDYWRFMAGSFSALLNKQTGFEIITVSEGLPSRAISLVKDEPTLDMHFHELNLGVSVLAKKIGPYNESLKWDIDFSEIYCDAYPKPK